MPNHRCAACFMPMGAPGKTGYCSERCLLWTFFGVPALHRREFAREQRVNRRRKTVPDDWTPPHAYPGVGDAKHEKEAAQSIYRLMKLRGELPTQ